jgi:class 3 adenylate cyclase
MFCDLVGSTALAGRLDPEELREHVRAYQSVGAEAIARFEGQDHGALGARLSSASPRVRAAGARLRQRPRALHSQANAHAWVSLAFRFLGDLDLARGVAGAGVAVSTD